MSQQRLRFRRFLLPVALLLMTSLSDTTSAIGIPSTVTDSDRRWWPVNNYRGGLSIPPVKELKIAEIARSLTTNSERQKKKHSVMGLDNFDYASSAYNQWLRYSRDALKDADVTAAANEASNGRVRILNTANNKQLLQRLLHAG